MPKPTCQTPISAKSKNKPPRKPKNTDRRTREYLTHQEIDDLRKAARKQGRHGHRDDTLILLMFRHGLIISLASSSVFAFGAFLFKLISIGRESCRKFKNKANDFMKN